MVYGDNFTFFFDGIMRVFHELNQHLICICISPGRSSLKPNLQNLEFEGDYFRTKDFSSGNLLNLGPDSVEMHGFSPDRSRNPMEPHAEFKSFSCGINSYTTSLKYTLTNASE
jgi:hypothetical protein